MFYFVVLDNLDSVIRNDLWKALQKLKLWEENVLYGLKNTAITMVALSGALFANLANAQDITLTVHHFLGPNSAAQKVLIEPWAERIEAQSEGRIAIEIYPSMSMGGRAPELYRQVRDGLADIVWTMPSYTPGQFPRLEVFELPGIHKNSAKVTNLAIQDMMPALQDDLSEVHPLLVHVHGGYLLHLRDKEVESIDDLTGMKLRTPTRVGGWTLDAWGGEPVSMPVPDLPQALSKGAVEGALLPFEAAGPMNLDELTSFSIEGPENLRAGTSVFLFAMNKERYESLPEDLRAIIDANSGANIAEEVGMGYDQTERDFAAEFAKSRPVVELSPEIWSGFEASFPFVIDQWSESVAEDGIDGVALSKAARASVEKYSN
jgi:TRAP-type C4-dicarboxylate transport system substrate-binding protein